MTKSRFSAVQEQLSLQTEAITSQNEKVAQLLSLYAQTKAELDELKAQPVQKRAAGDEQKDQAETEKHKLQQAFEKA